jgi:hypothetical protein
MGKGMGLGHGGGATGGQQQPGLQPYCSCHCSWLACPAAKGGMYAVIVVLPMFGGACAGYIVNSEINLRCKRTATAAAGVRRPAPAWGYPPSAHPQMRA